MDRQTPRSRLLELIDQHRPGHSLPQPFYVDPSIFDRDMDLLASRWSAVGHASEVAETGMFLVAELGRDSAIVVRGADGELRAFANVCRHRGSRICTSRQGHTTLFVCPYHAWSYQLDGQLKGARQTLANFESADHALHPLPIAVLGGIIFISFAPNPPALDLAREAMEALSALYGWTDAKVALRRTYSIAGNWKLAMENYHECYHCGPAHPEFSALHVLAQPRLLRQDAEMAAREASAREGRPLPDVEHWPAVADGMEAARLMHSCLSGGRRSGSRDGTPLAPLMPGVPSHDGNCAFAEIGMLSAFLAYTDHGVIYRFIPRSAADTDMEVLWLVHADARPGADYDEDALAWLWDVTSLADKRIIEDNQAGVASRAYVPGPYTAMESGTRAYVDHYLGALAAMTWGKG